MFIPILTFHLFLTDVNEASLALKTLMSFYDERVVQCEDKYTAPLSDIKLEVGTRVTDVSFKKGSIVDGWEFSVVDKGVPFVYAELPWSTVRDAIFDKDATRHFEDLAMHLALSSPGIVVSLQRSKTMRPNYVASKTSLLGLTLFRRVYLIGLQVDLFLFQDHFEKMVDLSGDSFVEHIVRSKYFDIRESIVAGFPDQSIRIVKRWDMRSFAGDCHRQLESAMSYGQMLTYKSNTSGIRSVDKSYS
jgi:hypothetical protein